jgi:hypothetical protein
MKKKIEEFHGKEKNCYKITKPKASELVICGRDLNGRILPYAKPLIETKLHDNFAGTFQLITELKLLKTSGQTFRQVTIFVRTFMHIKYKMKFTFLNWLEKKYRNFQNFA